MSTTSTGTRAKRPRKSMVQVKLGRFPNLKISWEDYMMDFTWFYGLYDFWIFWLMQYRDTYTVFVYIYMMTDGGWLDFGCWSPLIVAIGGVDHQQNHRRWGYVISVCNAMYLYMYLYYIRLVEFLDIWYINLHCIILHTSPYMIFTYKTCYIFTHIQILYLDIWYTSIHICSIYLHLAIAIVAS